MKSDVRNIAIGVSQAYPCAYIDGKQEQLLVIQEQNLDAALFDRLLALGFRRSGGSVYKPRCPNCTACLPIRIPVKDFTLSKRQKRTLKNNKDLRYRITNKVIDSHFELYRRYIDRRHKDGPMFPATQEQYEHFLFCNWLEPMFIEIYQGQKLVGVAVTDNTPNALSAIYSYFEPELEKRSLGAYMILIQCRIAQLLAKHYLYLGYQVDENRKMNYKRGYRPYEILSTQGWQYCDNS